jgi:hypothetical protein
VALLPPLAKEWTFDETFEDALVLVEIYEGLALHIFSHELREIDQKADLIAGMA